MNKQTNSHFAYTPNVNIGRSRWTTPKPVKTSANIGDLIELGQPIEILPGDTLSLDHSELVRLQTLVAPIFDNIYFDIYAFFVPNRLVWSHWKQFCGENTESAWIPETEYEVPQIAAPENGWQSGTLADYMSLPVGVPNIKVNALQARGYALICDTWFRSEVVTDPLNIYTGDDLVQGTNGDDYINDVAKLGKPFKAAKFFDLFTGCLPSPQKGSDVTISIGELTGNVVGNGLALGLTNGSTFTGLSGTNSDGGALTSRTGSFGHAVSTGSSGSQPYSGNGAIGVPTLEQLGDNPEKSGLIAVTDGNTKVITISQLRQAFQVQKFLEKEALYGSRYHEIIRGMFNITNPDARLQLPEYLGAARVGLNINSIYQTSQTADGTPQGNAAAYSVTGNSGHLFTKSFTEHGFVHLLAVARYNHSYQNQLPREFTRRSKYDYYWPVFAHLSNQAVKNHELYCQDGNNINPDTGKAYNDEVFGYQEAWYDYRYEPSAVTGEMRSVYQASLDAWHLADDFNELPHLSDEFIRENKNNLDRCLAVSSSVSNQYFGDFMFKLNWTRCMPLYSTPGLIDHM